MNEPVRSVNSLDNADRRACGECDDPVEGVPELCVEVLAHDVVDVRRRDQVGRAQQRVVGVCDRFGFEYVNRGEAGAACAQGREQRARRDQFRPRGIYQDRERLRSGL